MSCPTNLAASARIRGSGSSKPAAIRGSVRQPWPGPPSKLKLAYAYALTHIGLPVVYFTGNNLSGTNVAVNTWLKIGHGGALGDYGDNVLPNLVYINNNFARGREWERWSESGFYALERYDDLNSSTTPDINEGLLLVGLNNTGSSQTRYVQTAFATGTVLHDYTGNNATDLTVDGRSGQVGARHQRHRLEAGKGVLR